MIGLLLVAIAVVPAVETRPLLLGASTTRGDVRRIEQAIPGDGCTRVIHLKTMHLGPDVLRRHAAAGAAAKVPSRADRRGAAVCGFWSGVSPAAGAAPRSR